jgi:hypothetical protein
MAVRSRVKVLASVLLAVVASGLGACTVSEGPAALRQLELPEGGRVASDGWFADLEPHAGTRAERTGFFMLPAWLSFDTVAVAEDGASVRDSKDRFLNLGLAGINLPLLPLWVSAERRIARSGQPTSEASLLWTPLYATSSRTAWRGEDPWVSLRGMPLFYGRLDYGRPGEKPLVSFHNVLWTLGPAWGWFDFRDDPNHEKGWMFIPLVAANLGTLVWSSFELQSDSADLSLHGPLMGLLGYFSLTDHEERDLVRLVLGGALWMDISEEDSDGTVTDSMHGPLWGMFGWGRSDGRPAIRLLWIPISF